MVIIQFLCICNAVTVFIFLNLFDFIKSFAVCQEFKTTTFTRGQTSIFKCGVEICDGYLFGYLIRLNVQQLYFSKDQSFLQLASQINRYTRQICL